MQNQTDPDKLTVLSANESKKLFYKLKKRGFIIDKGRSTGNIWHGEKKLIWMTRDMNGNWILESLV